MFKFVAMLIVGTTLEKGAAVELCKSVVANVVVDGKIGLASVIPIVSPIVELDTTSQVIL